MLGVPLHRPQLAPSGISFALPARLLPCPVPAVSLLPLKVLTLRIFQQVSALSLLYSFYISCPPRAQDSSLGRPPACPHILVMQPSLRALCSSAFPLCARRLASDLFSHLSSYLSLAPTFDSTAASPLHFPLNTKSADLHAPPPSPPSSSLAHLECAWCWGGALGVQSQGSWGALSPRLPLLAWSPGT